MSDAKPVENPVAEATPAAAPASETPAAVEATPAEETKTDAPATTEAPAAEAAEAAAAPATTEETTALPKEEKTGEEEVKITAEPIYSGALGYKAPGLIKSLTFSKKYFWFGEEAAVSKDSLSGYLRGEKGEHAHSTVAWASNTGKGLLFFAKHADQKSSPQGALKLADATEVAKEGNLVFSFKVHGHKHSFEAATHAERDGWVVAVEKAVEEAKVAAEGVTSSEEYKETIEKLGKPAAAAPAAKAEEAAPKKSTEVKPAEGEDRRGSSSSSSGDDAEGKKKKNKKSKSRSVSRKRASVFGGLLGKKEHEKKDVKKEETKEEEKKEGEEAKEEAKAEAAAEAAAEAPAAEASEAAAPAEEAKPAEGEEAKPEEAKVEAPETKPATKANKRTSIFGGFFEKVRSPAAEKKETEVAPTVPPKDTEAPAATEEAAAKPAEGEEAKAAEEAPKTADGETPAATATTPAKEKGGFFSKFGKKEPKSPAAEAPKEEAKPIEGEAAPAAEGEAAGTTATATATPEPGKEKRRTSFFGNFGAKNNEGEADGEKKRGLGGLFRNPSKAVKGNKEKKENSAPAKVEEEAENKAEETPAAEEAKKEDEEAKKDEEPKAAIGDVVPDAVAVGQSSTPAVQATA